MASRRLALVLSLVVAPALSAALPHAEAGDGVWTSPSPGMEGADYTGYLSSFPPLYVLSPGFAIDRTMYAADRD